MDMAGIHVANDLSDKILFACFVIMDGHSLQNHVNYPVHILVMDSLKSGTAKPLWGKLFYGINYLFQHYVRYIVDHSHALIIGDIDIICQMG